MTASHKGLLAFVLGLSYGVYLGTLHADDAAETRKHAYRLVEIATTALDFGERAVERAEQCERVLYDLGLWVDTVHPARSTSTTLPSAHHPDN